jgi:orotidine-5'-phosphate decarboxylase
MAARGPLCVGIDPHPSLLAAWGMDDDGGGLRSFALRALEAAAGRAAAVKPQSALFERHGAAGAAVLGEVLAAARDLGVLTILDAKRGDIGSTMAAYAQAYLDDGAPLAADAVTLSPYLGFGSLSPALGAAAASGRGVFVLCLTSNPEGRAVQEAVGPDGRSVAAAIAAEAGAANRGAAPCGDVGLVVGATVGDAARRAGVDLTGANAPMLAPGFGAQGAGAEELRAVFGSTLGRVLVASSRAVLAAGPGPEDLAAAVRAAARGLPRAG